MNKKKIESIVGVFLILGHCFILFYIFSLTQEVFFMNQVLDLVFIISPLFSAYLTLIIKFFLKPAGKPEVEKVGFNYTFINFFYPLVFLISIVMSINLYKSQTIETFDNLKKVIGSIELSFGVYMGLIIEKLFPRTND